MPRPLAVVTGASSGIGMVFAQKLAPDHDLLLIARRKHRLDALAAERIAAEPQLSLLVNNAGFGIQGRFWESPLDAQERMHRLHITATVRLTHAAPRNMSARNSGAVINVASVAAFVHGPTGSSYGAS